MSNPKKQTSGHRHEVVCESSPSGSFTKGIWKTPVSIARIRSPSVSVMDSSLAEIEAIAPRDQLLKQDCEPARPLRGHDLKGRRYRWTRSTPRS